MNSIYPLKKKLKISKILSLLCVGMSSSVHVDEKRRLGWTPGAGLNKSCELTNMGAQNQLRFSARAVHTL